MLKTRIITGLTLVALGLLGIIYLSEFWFALVTAALVLIGAWEWANIIGFHHRLLPKMSYCLVMIVGLTIAYFSPHLWIVIIGVAWWLLSLFFIMRFANQPRWMTTIINNTWGKSIIGLLVLIPCWIGMLVVRDSPHGLFYFLYLGFLIGCADTGAYAAGRLFGRRKLIPAVSPGKIMGRCLWRINCRGDISNNRRIDFKTSADHLAHLDCHRIGDYLGQHSRRLK